MHTLTGVYALDALDDLERAAFERHLPECPSCQAEVAELTETASLLAVSAATPVPPGLRSDVLAAVSQVRQVSPLPSLSTRAAQPRWYQQPAALAAGLLLVVSGVLGGLTLEADQRADLAEQRAERITAIATDPDGVKVVVPVSTGGHGTIIAAGGTAVLRTSDIEKLSPGQAYQLWLLRGDSTQSVGVLGRGGELEAVVEGMRSGDALGLTIEPAGGSRAPTGALVLRAQMA